MGNHIDAAIADKKGTSIGSATKRCRTCGEVYITEHYCQGLKLTAPTGIIDLSEEAMSSATNNGGATDYYRIDKSWEMIQDIIEDRNMNYAQANIFKAAFCFNQGRHSGTDYERELNKIIYFANRELKQIKDN